MRLLSWHSIAPRTRYALTASLLSAGCSLSVQPEAGREVDAHGMESGLVDRLEVIDTPNRVDRWNGDDADTPVLDVPDDGGSLVDNPQVIPQDGFSDVDAVDAGPCEAPGDASALPTTNQSCRGPDGAPAEHCREVWQCGGPFTMGSVNAWIQPGQNRDWRQQTPCDISTGTVHPGFIDAYAVSVARFRAWVRAGAPRPANGTVVFDRFVWNQRQITIDGDPRYCTFRAEPGVNDDIPVTCVDYSTAIAFCYWDGKHLATDAAWEFVATNRGTTERPFADDPRGNPCHFGDVLANQCKPMNPTQHFPIDAFPGSQTRDPRGVFGLWGGVYSLMHNSRVPGCAAPFRDGYNVNNDVVYPFVVRGISAYEFGFEYDRMNLSRSTRADFYGGGAGHGIRCMRWVPEPRG